MFFPLSSSAGGGVGWGVWMRVIAFRDGGFSGEIGGGTGGRGWGESMHLAETFLVFFCRVNVLATHRPRGACV